MLWLRLGDVGSAEMGPIYSYISLIYESKILAGKID
jgi:UDP-N-acetylmuramyl pentapeptide phosphotransferase/UDP-N-acetylglucosamine-1-phosphate transferase